MEIKEKLFFYSDDGRDVEPFKDQIKQERLKKKRMKSVINRLNPLGQQVPFNSSRTIQLFSQLALQIIEKTIRSPLSSSETVEKITFSYSSRS